VEIRKEIPKEIPKQIRPKFHQPRTDGPRELTGRGTTFRVRIPSDVIVQPKGPSHSTGGHGTTAPSKGSGGRLLKGQ
jgi:hypothetical protein